MSDARISRRLDEKRIEKASGEKLKIMGPTPDADRPKCATCRFLFDCGPNPQDYRQHVFECRWGPPNVTTLPGGGGIARVTSHPTVTVDNWCYRHESIEPPKLGVAP